jgi:hypothetical protein
MGGCLPTSGPCWCTTSPGPFSHCSQSSKTASGGPSVLLGVDSAVSLLTRVALSVWHCLRCKRTGGRVGFALCTDWVLVSVHKAVDEVRVPKGGRVGGSKHAHGRGCRVRSVTFLWSRVIPPIISAFLIRCVAVLPPPSPNRDPLAVLQHPVLQALGFKRRLRAVQRGGQSVRRATWSEFKFPKVRRSLKIPDFIFVEPNDVDPTPSFVLESTNS